MPDLTDAERKRFEKRWDSLDFIGDPKKGWMVLVEGNIPRQLRLMLTAALATYQLGNKSIDHILKRYGPIWTDILDGKSIDEINASNSG
jgi:hypothetical protein